MGRFVIFQSWEKSDREGKVIMKVPGVREIIVYPPGVE